MASYQAPGKSLVALLLTQIEALPEIALSQVARRCLVDYARHLERQGLGRDGDHLAAGRLLNACEIASYLPAGKLGKGSVELTRLQERIERTLTAERRAEKRTRRDGRQEDPRHRGGRRTPPLSPAVAPVPDDDVVDGEAGAVPAENENNDAAEAAGGEA